MNPKRLLASAPRRGALWVIRGYQLHVSPRKGFTCAHLVAEGGLSCSAAIARLIAEHGVLRAAVPTLARFLSCHEAAAKLRSAQVRTQGVCCCGGIPIPFKF